MSSIHSQRNADGSVSHHGGSALNHQMSMSQGLHGQLSQGGHTDNASRVYSAEQLDQAAQAHQIKTIISYLNDKITTFIMSGKDVELQKIKIEGDLVTSFFDSVDLISDQTLYQFIEDMKKDIDLIL
jgi:pectate lyase